LRKFTQISAHFYPCNIKNIKNYTESGECRFPTGQVLLSPPPRGVKISLGSEYTKWHPMYFVQLNVTLHLTLLYCRCRSESAV